MSGKPDPKPELRARVPIRVVDPSVLRAARLRWDECAACHRPPANAHHVIPRGGPYFGDDVIENVVLVCGSGTRGCHGALHGAPYVDASGRRWTETGVRQAIGETIGAGRPDTIAYVTGKLGEIQGLDWLYRHYHLTTILEAR